jgi:hypothetical protein
MPKKTKPSEVRVVMAKRVAASWLEATASSEYRLTVYSTPHSLRYLPQLLGSWRNSKIRLGSMDPVLDLGIKCTPNSITVWSRNRVGMVALDRWLTERNCETTGVW